MTQRGSPYDNSLAERINGTIKNDFFPNRIYRDHTEAKDQISRIIVKYNELRPHDSIDYLTPQQAHEKEGQIKKDGKTNIILKKGGNNKRQ
jgi:transposase InsO family protein